MTIGIFGASGRTGRLLVEKALAAGYCVNVLVRNPARLGIQNESLRIIEGDVQDTNKVCETIAGTDAIISVLGPTTNQPVYEISRGMENIISCMKRNGIRRLVASTGAGVGDAGDEPRWFDRVMNFLLERTARFVFEDMKRTSEKVRAAELDWTLVRVPMLVEGAATGRVRVGYVGKGTGIRITRADLAEFVLMLIYQGTYVHQAPVISN